MDKKEPTFKEIWDLARRGMVWKGKPIETRMDKHESARMWAEEENITKGIFCVKSAAIHDNYTKWCKERGVTGKSVLSPVTFGKFCIKQFQHTEIKNSTHYYISKDLVENEESKKKRKETWSRRKETPGSEKN